MCLANSAMLLVSIAFLTVDDAKKDDAEARELVYKRLAAGASFLRDLAYTAWIESAKPVPRVDPINRMENPANPRYNPAAGSAPAQ